MLRELELQALKKIVEIGQGFTWYFISSWKYFMTNRAKRRQIESDESLLIWL